MGNVWPAQHSQIYPELAKLVADGLIAQTGEGPRGRKATRRRRPGSRQLRPWLRDTEPDYSIRSEPLLRIFCLWVLPTDEALAHLARDRAEYARHLEHSRRSSPQGLGPEPRHPCRRLTIEFGRRFYAAQFEWIDWATEQVAAGNPSDGRTPPDRRPSRSHLSDRHWTRRVDIVATRALIADAPPPGGLLVSSCPARGGSPGRGSGVGAGPISGRGDEYQARNSASSQSRSD